MHLVALLSALAHAESADLDGDGEAESVSVSGEQVRVGDATLGCGGDSFPCTVEVVDVRSADRFREVIVCEPGPRDDMSCVIYAYRKGQLKALADKGQVVYAGGWRVTGNGIPLGELDERIYTALRKYVMSQDGLSLTLVRQPYDHVDYALHVDDTFPIHLTPGKLPGPVVANVRPDSDITILLEHGEFRGWYLVRISSGLTGWVSRETLSRGSMQLMALFAAG